jgi:mitochondrial fission protein ELM1
MRPAREVRHREPERIVLRARSESGKPPVRMFVGTEPAQYRAERVFMASVEAVRDPDRVYEIHLMKDLDGFERRFWNTSFTNYRFAVPDLAGGTGRAIYNDIDQIYLADPGELYDLDLGGHGYLAVSETDTSVMLIDCERMARFWSLRAAQQRRKYKLIRSAKNTPGVYGRLDGAWNARDHEYREGESKLIHYTIIHKQPWRPFPERFVYQPNSYAGPWFDLDRRADQTGYHVHGPDRPSRRFQSLVRAGGPAGVAPRAANLEFALERLVERSGARSLLRVEAGAGTASPIDSGTSGVESTRIGFLEALERNDSGATHEGVVCLSGLDTLPEEDLPWAVEQLFARAGAFVFAAVHSHPAKPGVFMPPAGTVGRREWWTWAFECASRHHPEIHWEVAFAKRGSFDKHVEFLQGGRFLGGEPRVWVLVDHKPGHKTQSLGLAEELGWPYERFDLDFNGLAELPNVMLGSSLRGLAPKSAALIRAPWPDVVVAAGRRTAPVASWVRKQSQGTTRTVQMGRMGAFHDDDFDLAVAPAYAGLYPDHRRIDTAIPITRVSAPALDAAGVEWKGLLERAAAPRVALLVGGSDPSFDFRPEVARKLGADVAEMVRRVGGSVFVTTSRRTPSAAADALEQALGDAVAHFHRWSADEASDANPYLGYLALADALVVTGESASMLAEACSCGKPIQIYPLPEISLSGGPRAIALRALRGTADWVVSQAYAQPNNKRGFERPQRGVGLWCAKLVSHGVVRPTSRIGRMHEVLIDRGLARFFDGRLEGLGPDHVHLSEARRVADGVRELMGTPILGSGAPLA